MGYDTLVYCGVALFSIFRRRGPKKGTGRINDLPRRVSGSEKVNSIELCSLHTT